MQNHNLKKHSQEDHDKDPNCNWNHRDSISSDHRDDGIGLQSIACESSDALEHQGRN